MSFLLRKGECVSETFASVRASWRDERGNRYGQWTVIHPTVWRMRSGDSGTGHWLMRCDCGTYRVNRMHAVRREVVRGNVPACEHCRIEIKQTWRAASAQQTAEAR